ncbi:MAG TPA: FHA domain-containing protein [Vicinamibacterales bacterium]|nr:FHA domain-containing protein [Vicinamibacterales bacterium]
MARLHIVGGDGVEQWVEVRDRRLQIGRGRDNDVVLPDPEKGVSRTHAELRLENDRYVIVDLQSQNGTWLNGRRVERAEVPFGAEIAVGAYRLRLLNDQASVDRLPSRSLRADPLDDMRATERHDPPRFPMAPPARPSAGMPRWALAVAVAVLIIVALAAVAWVARPGKAGQPPASSTGPSVPAATPEGTPSPAAPPQKPSAPTVRSEMPDLPAESPVKKPAIVRKTDTPRVVRRPGESADAWRSRGAALQMRYGYSKAALDRGDYAAAAGGFEAILIEEPGYLDAPGLLVQAQQGMRASARSLFQVGNRLDAAGDWVGALQKYEQARQIYASIPGLSEALQRVRGKLQTAGTNAFNQAKQHEANGRPQEALKEYEKALQWLPPDDPNRQVARARIEQLKRND